MSKISIKTDFADGEKLFAQQLNNNFLVIQAGINANEENLQAVIDQAIIELDNELEEITADRGWDWNGGDRVTFFKGTTSQVNAQEIKNGQMLYNTETGETALDDNGNRIVTGSGNVVTVSNNAPTNPATKEWIKPIIINGTDTAEEYFRDANNNWKKILCEPSGDTLPIGAITQFSGSIAPTNWLFCNGQAISRTEYSELFAIIGTHYGEGDGSTTFNLPDFIGRVPVGLDAEDTDFDNLGDFGGAKTHTLTVSEMPSHSHEFNFKTSGAQSISGNYGAYLLGGTSDDIIASTGGGQAHNNLQPYLVTNFIIKVKQSVGIVGTVTNNIDDPNTNAVPNASTVKNCADSVKDYVDEKSLDIFSTEEQVIGKWIDGKPIYRKVCVINSPVIGDTDYPHYISNFKTLISATANGTQANGNQQYFPRAVPRDSNWSLNIGDITSTTFSLQIASNNTGNYAFTKVNVILEYTKTTD